jgi:hypothetical protein
LLVQDDLDGPVKLLINPSKFLGWLDVNNNIGVNTVIFDDPGFAVQAVA